MSARLATIADLSAWPHPYVCPSQLARYLSVSRRTVYHWITKGALPARKVGGSLLIRTRVARSFADGRAA